MARRRSRAKVEWPAWRYGPSGESAIFERAEDVPPDWYSAPQQAFEPPAPKPELCKETAISRLQEADIPIDPRWGKAKLWEEVEKAFGK